MTQLFEVEGHPTVPTATAPTIPAKLVDDFTPTLIDFGDHHLCPGCGEPIAMRRSCESIRSIFCTRGMVRCWERRRKGGAGVSFGIFRIPAPALTCAR